MSVIARKGRAALPSVDRALRDAGGLIECYGRALVTEAVRDALARHREEGSEADIEIILADAGLALARLMRKSQRRVFNLTGTVLHTNLGRAPLPEEAIEAAAEAMREPTTLEYETDGGRRGERDDHVAGWLKRLSRAEAALAVNNNAGALVLVLNALAAGKETIVSRGELIEIGGAFRLPDIMARAGTTLREVGTTNRTHLRDFAAAIGPQTGLILKVHTSNYAIQGFTAAAPTPELAELAHRHDLPLVEDLGSGTLVDLDNWGLPHEPTVAEALKAGADLVTFSGDKLLGGPQAGLMIGRREAVAAARGHPLARALRIDKLSLAALEATLMLYREPQRARREIPVLAMLDAPARELASRARRLHDAIGPGAEVIRAVAKVGGGALPLVELEGPAVALSTGEDPVAVARALRAGDPPVIARIHDGHVVLDPRTLDDDEVDAAAAVVRRALHQG
jgi:L-seryl-tRNA(Ser) seleniumtransferase